MTARGQGIVYQYVLDGDYRPPRSESPAVGDYIWNVDTVISAEASGFDYPAGTRKVYLTRSPGDTESARPFWSATLTPGLGKDEFAGYKSTGFSYRGLNEKDGTLSSDEVGFEGVDYTVEAILFHTGGDTEGVYRTLTVATSAQLPEEKGIGLEVAYDSRTVVYWIDTADTSRAEGDEGAHLYEWDDIPSDHGWGSGGARSVSLLVPPPPGGMVHPRVLLDALLTVGTYADDNDPDESVWGFVDAGVTGFTAGTAGHLADAAFVYGGIEYGIRLLGVYGTATTVTQVLIAFEDAAGVALPADAAVGVELATGGGETVLVDWAAMGRGRRGGRSSGGGGRGGAGLERHRGRWDSGGAHPQSRRAGRAVRGAVRRLPAGSRPGRSVRRHRHRRHAGAHGRRHAPADGAVRFRRHILRGRTCWAWRPRTGRRNWCSARRRTCRRAPPPGWRSPGRSRPRRTTTAWCGISASMPARPGPTPAPATTGRGTPAGAHCRARWRTGNCPCTSRWRRGRRRTRRRSGGAR